MKIPTYRLLFVSALLMFALAGSILALPQCPAATCSNVADFCQLQSCPIQSFPQGQCDDGGTTRNYYLVRCFNRCGLQTLCTLR